MTRLILLVSFVALIAGCDSAEFASYNFELRTDREAYGATDLVIATLRSEATHRASHGLCYATLYREAGGTWEPVRRTRPGCVYSPSYIYPGGVVVDTLDLAEWAIDPGERYHYDVGVGSGGAAFTVSSNRFEVTR